MTTKNNHSMNRNYKEISMNVAEVLHFGSDLSLLKMRSDRELPPMRPGQFVNVLPPRRANVLLRRPISICMALDNELWLLVKNLGRGSKAICECEVGESLSILMPLGHGFTTDIAPDAGLLLVGGGVGIAPLLYLGKTLRQQNCHPEFLLGGRSAADIPLTEEFAKYGTVYTTTEDGSMGIKGLVTQHSAFAAHYDFIYSCGPMPMMKAVAREAVNRTIECEVSLENRMACGIGACLCCVEDTKDEGNVCTCVKGPVFNIKALKWQI